MSNLDESKKLSLALYRKTTNSNLSIQEINEKIADKYTNDAEHRETILDYLTKEWFIPASPVITCAVQGKPMNSDDSVEGNPRSLPISCYLQEVEDSMQGILENNMEAGFLSSSGGGIGTDWSKVRSIGESVTSLGETSGIIPFLKLQEAQTIAISQGSTRRGATAAYLRVDHPEIEEFVLIRTHGGDDNRRMENLHHAIILTQAFMDAVKNDTEYNLISPRTAKVTKSISARLVWRSLIKIRKEKGEPYLVFLPNVDEGRCELYKRHNMRPQTSNLCSEIFVHAGRDYLGNKRTAVCCLSSLNVAKWDEYKDDLDRVAYNIMKFLDNVIQYFIDNTENRKGYEHVNYSSKMERSVGLGVLGFHTYLQQHMIPFSSDLARGENYRIFRDLQGSVDKANHLLAIARGACPDYNNLSPQDKLEYAPVRFANTMAIAPTVTISKLLGVSGGVEPIQTNVTSHTAGLGKYLIINKVLLDYFDKNNINTNKAINQMIIDAGSVVNVDMPEEDKAVFATAFELDQRALINLAGDRQKFIDQAQSLNLFNPAQGGIGIDAAHAMAMKAGIKSLYYIRSTAERSAMSVLSSDNTCEACEG